MAVAAGVRQPFDDEDAGALAPGGAVGVVGERLAAPVRCQSALAAELQEDRGRRHDGDAAGQGQVTLPRAQCLRGEVQGDQGGGAGGVDGDGRAFQTEGVGDAAGQDAGRVADAVVAGVVGVRQQRGVVLEVGAGEHAGAAAAQGERVDAGAFQGLPADLQEQPLLGVGADGLARGDAEEGGVEVGDAVDEPAGAGVTASRRARFRVVERLGVPAAVARPVGHGVGAVLQQPPQVVGAGHAAGEAAAHRDDRDRFVVPGLGRRQALSRLVEIGRDLLQVAEELVLIAHAFLTRSAGPVAVSVRRCRGRSR